MDLDDPVCLCFRVSHRKLINFLRTERPTVASQLTACGGAGTGCGWCVPFLRKLFDRETLDGISPAEYAAEREAYRAAKGADAQ